MIVSQLFDMIEALKLQRDANSRGNYDEAGRNLSIAITHLEDATMRINRANAILLDKYIPVDVEDS